METTVEAVMIPNSQPDVPIESEEGEGRDHVHVQSVTPAQAYAIPCSRYFPFVRNIPGSGLGQN